jgi:rod shape determining protein RodA
MIIDTIPTPIRRLPWLAILPLVAITGFGLVVLFSAAGGSLRPWALNQGVRFIVFLGLTILLSRISVERWLAAAYPAYVILLGSLLAVELLGAISGGSRRWLDLGIIRFQPSELMKPVIVLTLARFYHYMPRVHQRGWSAIWPAALLAGIPAALIMLQPDLGTALMVLLGSITVMFLAGLPLRLFFGGIGALAASFPIVWSMMHDYQKNRVLIFLDPESDPLGAGYHISQSKIAIGSGGFAGKGFLHGTQSHLDYLPELHTDFVFATMAEEWGLLGGLFILTSFGLLLAWGLRVAIGAEARFAKLTAAGLTTTIFFYLAINLAMVMGLAPVVGIPLPLVSYGGSAMMTVMLCVSVLMSISRDGRRSLPYRG